ncbi:MAG: hypothetical protein CSA62_03020 [Planctomycetota bacterium]|nr:MAG: hypothetical protein CSA62_03020 [Planctomycetota bacterium]
MTEHERNNPLPHGDEKSQGQASAAFLDAGSGPIYLVPGRRLIAGSSLSCDIRLTGPGISPHHARIYLRPEGQLAVKPLSHRHLRVDNRVVRRITPFALGSSIGIGLHEIETGPAENHFYLHLLEAWREIHRGFSALRRSAKWALLSIIAHLLALLALLPVLLHKERPRTWLYQGRLSQQDEQHEDIEEPSSAESLLSTEISEPLPPAPKLPDLLPPPSAEPVADKPKMEELPGFAVIGIGAKGAVTAMSGDFLLSKLGGKGRDTGSPSGLSKKGKIGQHKIENKRFARTVSRLRNRGFELVFAFDSTGSMSPTLSEAKHQMQNMLSLLRAIAPKLRIGIITYRDHGDDYLTRELPLGASRYSTLAFLSSVRSGGGGDNPEALDIAMNKARRFPWSTGAVKALVIIGDAPPHKGRATASALRSARAIRRRFGRVHVVITTNSDPARKQLSAIAKAGGGELLALRERRALALTLLSAALGPEARKDVDMLLRSAHSSIPNTTPPLSALLSNLRSEEPDPDIIEGWRKAKRSEIETLLRKLHRFETSTEGRMALVYLINLWAERAGIGSFVAPENLSKKSPLVPPELLKQLKLVLSGRGMRER